MLSVVRSTSVSGKGCEELGRMGLLDASMCCKICHSADGRSPSATLGPCHATLPDGGDAFVCCAGKKQLLSRSRR